ncbi:MAG: hypothetical protein KatS3mg111_0400 [Pirellulaceae bacterium]|nr:MAG: hypothetical protein KatS3mg111_0400 [Pirellulaceae bacterium]
MIVIGQWYQLSERSCSWQEAPSGPWRRATRRTLMMVLVVLLFPATAGLWAQSTDSSAEGNWKPNILSVGTLPVEAELRFRDDTGELIFVPNVSMQELIQARQLASGSGPNPFRQYEIRKIRGDIQVRNGTADVDVTVEVALGPGSHAADIPLGLSSLQIASATPDFSGPRALHQFVAEVGGYRWILQDRASDAAEVRVHTVRLRGKTRVADEATRSAIQLPLPTAPTELSIALPEGAVDPKMRSEDVWEYQPSAEGILLHVLSRGGNFSLGWRRRSVIGPVASVEVQSRTLFELSDPKSAWKATTNLSVRWHGEDADNRFMIRLPPGASWRVLPQPDFDRFTISVDRTTEAPGGDEPPDREQSTSSREVEDPSATPSTSPPVPWQHSAVLVVENQDIAQSPSLDIAFEWEWTPPQEEDQQTAKPWRVPTVLLENVDTHRGMVDLQYPASYSLVYEEGENSQVIQQGQVPDLFAVYQLRYEFRSQPSDLLVAFRAEASDPIVRPIYHVHIGRQRVSLRAWLRCSFDVTRQVMELGVHEGPWQLVENQAQAYAITETNLEEEGELLEVQARPDGQGVIIRGTAPDSTTYAMNRRVEQLWRLEAELTREKSAADGALSFTLPTFLWGDQPHIPSGVLIVSTDDNVVLQWDEENSEGLLVDSLSPDYTVYLGSEGASKEPRAYRFHRRSEPPRWAGQVRFLPRSVAMEEVVEAEVLHNALFLQQEFLLQIANDPLSELRLAVPGQATQVRFFLDGALVQGDVQSAPSIEGGEESQQPRKTAKDRSSMPPVIYALRFPSPLLGHAVLRVEATYPLVQPLANSATVSNEAVSKAAARAAEGQQWSIDLATLDEPATTPFRRRFVIEGDAFAELRNSQGQVLLTHAPTGGVSQRYVTVTTNQFELAVLPRTTPQAGRVEILASWLQTAISGDQRRDRFVVRFRGEVDYLRIRLPDRADVRNNRVRALLDGMATDAVYDSRTDALVVAVAPAAGQRSSAPLPPRTLDLFYSVRSGLQSLTLLDVGVPQIDGAEVVGRFYWQLATPNTQHLVWHQPTLTPEWRWQWNGTCFVRRSVLDEPELTRLLQAAEVDELPVSVNRYLLSGSLPEASIRVWVAARHVLWLPVGLLAIVLTVLVLNVPYLRGPWFGLVLGSAVVSLAVVAPDIGILFGQTAVLSLMLSALIVIAQAAIDNRVRRRSVFVSRPSTRMEASDQFSVAQSVRIAPVPGGSSLAPGESTR